MSDGPAPTLDQRRARHAWEAVARVKGRPGDVQKAYQREAKRLPVRTLTAGVGHALAFLKAKNNDANDELLRDVADWIIDKRKRPDSPAERPPADALIKEIVKGDGTFLQVTTDEVLAYMQWLTRFAEAELEDDRI